MCESGNWCIYVSTYGKPGNCSSTYFCISVCFLYDEWNFLIFSQTSMSTAVAFGLLIVAIAIIIYTMIKNVLISAVIGVVGEVALVIVYVVKSSIFQGGIQKVLNVFNLSGHYENFTNGVFDVTGIVYFISVVAICLFLTMQSIQKRRWN